MNYYPDSYAQSRPYGFQLDMPAIMRRVYLWLAMGLALGFGVAFALGQVVNSELASGQSRATLILYNPVVFFGSLIVYLVLGFAFYPIVRRASLATGLVLYFVFTAVFGFLISSVFVIYSSVSIAEAFVTTAAMFAVMAALGYTTRLDLSRIGSIALMALFGIIIASLVNLFLHNAVLYWVVTYVGVVVFCALTAYDMQWIKKQAVTFSQSADELAVNRIALIGAFHLFLDFVNLFLLLLRIFGRGGRS
jgi:FtsH-binding integral membrane protein